MGKASYVVSVVMEDGRSQVRETRTTRADAVKLAKLTAAAPVAMRLVTVDRVERIASITPNPKSK
jgi:hypothetical protein